MGFLDSLFKGNKEVQAEKARMDSLLIRASQDDRDACLELGNHYFDKQDYLTAKPYYEKAFSIKEDGGIAYRIYYCTWEKSVREAYSWLFKAEKLGSADALRALDDACANPEYILQYSIAIGHDVKRNGYDNYEILQSKEKGFPFWFESEEEWRLGDACSPLFFGSALTVYPDQVISALIKYGNEYHLYDELEHPLKLRYINKILSERAAKGSLTAKYCQISSRNPYRLGDDLVEKYTKEINDAAEYGNKEALYLRGCLARWKSRERFSDWLAAAKLGNSDAAYDLRQEIYQIAYDVNGSFAKYEATTWLNELGASCTSGAHIAYMQECWGKDLSEGSGHAVVNYDESLYWTRKAREGGSRLSLHYLEEHESDIRKKTGYSQCVEQLSPEKVLGWFDAGLVDNS